MDTKCGHLFTLEGMVTQGGIALGWDGTRREGGVMGLCGMGSVQISQGPCWEQAGPERWGLPTERWG